MKRGRDNVAELRRALASRRPIALLGSGLIGRECAHALRALGHDAICVADETPGKAGTSCEGLPVVTPRDAAERLGPTGLVLCCFYRPTTSLAAVCARLQEETSRQTLPFLPLFRLAPASFSNAYAFGPQPDDDASRLEAGLSWLADRLHDGASREMLEAQVEFRRTLDPTVLPSPTRYFDALAPAVPFPRAIFVDCGAYDGDTVKAFLEASGGQFRRIVAFEPDPRNASALCRGAAALLGERISSFVCHAKGVWSEETTLGFSATGTPASALSADGEVRVPVTALDRCVEAGPDDAVVIKLDVEGAEAPALRGATRLLRRDLTAVCVSVYHRPADLVDLARLLDVLQPQHELLLRSHGYDGADLVLYSLPRSGTR